MGAQNPYSSGVAKPGAQLQQHQKISALEFDEAKETLESTWNGLVTDKFVLHFSKFNVFYWLCMYLDT